jgi:hypothetical protein
MGAGFSSWAGWDAGGCSPLVGASLAMMNDFVNCLPLTGVCSDVVPEGSMNDASDAMGEVDVT